MKDLKMGNSFESGGKMTIVSSKDMGKLKKTIHSVNIADILSPKFHDRKEYSRASIEDLAANILCSNNGKLLQPIVLRETDKGYERIIGFRRVEAYKFLKRKKIEAIILSDISDEEAMLLMLSENIQREDPNLYDQTIGILDYIAISINLSQEEVKKLLYKFRNVDNKAIKNTDELIENRDKLEYITKKIGKITVSTLINRLKIFTLHEKILESLKAGEISFTAAVEINKAKDNNKVNYLLEKVKNENLSKKGIKEYLASFKVLPKKNTHIIKYELKEDGEVVQLSFKSLGEGQMKKLKLFLETL